MTSVVHAGIGGLATVRAAQQERHERAHPGHDEAADCIEVHIAQGTVGLRSLESAWRALSASLPEPRFFHAFDWQWAAAHHLEPDPDAVHYISFFCNGRPIAIFPLRRTRRTVGRVPMWLWEQPSHPHLALGDLLVAPDQDVAKLIRRLAIVLNQQKDLPWDALHFPDLLDDPLAVRGRLWNTLRGSRVSRTGCSMYFNCEDMATALTASSESFLRNLRRQGRKLVKRGAVSLCIARRGDGLDAAFAEFLRVEASGWKGDEGKASAIALHPHLVGFYGELKDRFAASDACLIALLRLDGLAIAAQFCLLSGSTLYILKIAYDEAWRAEAPGSQLMYRMLEYCCGHPDIGRLSLVTGPAWAVGRWNPQSSDVCDAYVFNSSLRGLGGLAMQTVKARFFEGSQSTGRSTP